MTRKNIIEERYLYKNASEPFYLSVSKGTVRGHSYVHKFGANLDIDPGADPESIWTAGGLYPWSSLTTAQTLYAISDSSSDTDILTIQGLDSNYNLIEEEVTMTGTTAVTTTNQFLRVYRMIYNHSAVNDGTVTVRVNSGTGTVVAQIDGGKAQTLMAVYTVPANHSAYLLCLDASLNKGEDGSIHLYQRPFNKSFKIAHMAEIYEDSYRYDFAVPLKFTEKTDIDLRIDEVETNNTRCTANFDLLLVNENNLSS